MARRIIYYVTNRRHTGRDRFKPTGYGKNPSGDGIENLRFGKATLSLDEKAERTVTKLMAKKTASGRGDGAALSGKMTSWASGLKLMAYKETIDPEVPDDVQRGQSKLGSTEMFRELREGMAAGRDLLIFVHGYNVSWKEAAGSALALQEMLNRRDATGGAGGNTMVVLFSWPSDGSMMPFAAYKSDRADAQMSGYALGRALLKLRDYLAGLSKAEFCGQNVNLLCHSMGNWVLQNAVTRIEEHSTGSRPPRILDQTFLCAPDIGEDVFDVGKPLNGLNRLTKAATIYFNRGDIAMDISDYTKGNTDRLGAGGVANPLVLHRNVHQVDCSEVVTGVVEHSYFMDGRINIDIRKSLDQVPQNARVRARLPSGNRNTWIAT